MISREGGLAMLPGKSGVTERKGVHIEAFANPCTVSDRCRADVCREYRHGHANR